MPIPSPSFQGRSVLAFESRRAKEIEALIATFGGRPIVAPAVREVPTPSEDAQLEFAHALIRGDVDAVVFLTGVGVRALVGVVDRAGLRDAFLEGLGRAKVITRGPKPVAALRELGVPVWVNAAEPNTWREVLAAVDGEAVSWPVMGKRMAVQEYGVSNVELLDALRARGARVAAVRAYEWAMPEDLEPLETAAAAVSRGEVAVVLVTSGIQIVHFWRVVRDRGLESDVRRGLSAALIASIGPSASSELRRHGIEPSLEPSHPKMGLLVREAAERVWRA